MTTGTANVRRRPWAWIAMAVVVSALTGAATWAVFTVLQPAEDPLEATAFTSVSVELGEVGSSIDLNVVAEWSPVPIGSNQAAGIVTGVSVAPGDEATPGSTLYLVNQRPVVVAQGEVPAYRAIGAGAAGADVAQLQEMLRAIGLFSANTDGKAGYQTVAAIKAWQKSLGLAQTGTVELGDVIFVTALPTRVSLDDEIVSRGKSVSGGEQVVRGLPDSPLFTLPVTEAQSVMVPTGTPVQVTSPGGAIWEAVAGDRKADSQTQAVVISLTGTGGAALCGEQCTEVPVTGETLLPSKVITVATVQGLVVPSSALKTDADGQIVVIDADGAKVPVTVVTSARGMSVIEGVESGVKVRVPATEDSGSD